MPFCDGSGPFVRIHASRAAQYAQPSDSDLGGGSAAFPWYK
tara:strand:- start:536 stop:658 length:123 start_codon:yes stop_codon:yes gene_type:complete